MPPNDTSHPLPGPSPQGPTATALPLLDGTRIRLRAFREDDLDDLFAIHSDPRVMRYWSFPAWTESAQARERLAGAIAGRDPERLLCWAIARRADDRLIGGVTLFAIDRSQGRAEVGYSLGSAHWGQGLAQDAMRLALDHAFDGLGLRRVEADIDPRNTASCRLAERLGFVLEGRLRERWQVQGEVSDTALYGLLAREWRNHHLSR
jgi:ribosomal-protein-alanine N-acetyltransferase